MGKRVESGSLISIIEIQPLFVHVVNSLGIDLFLPSFTRAHFSDGVLKVSHYLI